MPPTDTAEHDTTGQDDTADLDAADDAAEGQRGDGTDDGDPAEPAAGASKRDPAAKKKADEPSDSPDFDASDIDDIIAAAEPEKAKADDEDAEKEPDDEDAETDAKDDTEAEDDEAGDDAEATKDDAEGEKKPEDEPELTDEERARLPKKVNRQIDRLLKQRTDLEPAANFGRQVHEHAIEKGKMTPPMLHAWVETGIRVNTGKASEAVQELVSLALNVETKGKAATMKAPERAQLLRRLADRISPAPKVPEPEPILLPDDLADLVRSETISRPVAIAEARARLAKEKGGKTPEPVTEPEPEAEDDEVEPDTTATDAAKVKADADLKAGREASTKVYREFEAKYKSDFKTIEPEVMKLVKERAPHTLPSGYGQLVRDCFDQVVRKYRKAPPTAPKTPQGKSGSAQPASQKAKMTLNDDPDDYSDVVNIARGKPALRR